MASNQLFLKTLDGTTAVLRDVSTISDLHSAAIAAHGSIDSLDLRLSYASRPLTGTFSGATSLKELGIGDHSTVFAAARLLGGGKKRKKKTYTKPKKIKHKQKPVKMAVLKYYNISDDGKIERLRKECSADTCGAGVFMASHSDRVYCGKCGLTYVKT